MNNNENQQRIRSEKRLPPPLSLLASLPPEAKTIKAVSAARHNLTQIIQGKDSRLIVLVGPCSLHEEVAALDYADRLKKAAERFADELFLVMRTYVSKPRSADGWKGLIYDPQLDNSHDI